MSRAFKIPLQNATADFLGGVMDLYTVRNAYYQEIDRIDATANGEVPWQIREGCEYEYTLPTGLYFEDNPTVSQSVRDSSQGRIRPGNYVGRLKLDVLKDGVRVAVVELESTSVKMFYRDDYRTMLNDLAEKSAELLMSSEEFVFQHYEIDPTADAKTLYQQFAFAKSLIVSDSFDAAVARVCASPIKQMHTVRKSCPATRSGRLGRDAIRQIASSVNRDALPAGHYLARRFGLDSIPHEIEYDAREESVDVPENRFVKFVLESFMVFLRDISLLENAESLHDEAEALAEKLDYRLGDPLFRSVASLDRIPLANPALQRREGYREILKSWLMFESAAKLAWKGGEDVYEGGKRNVAVLYEYWAFFKLFDVITSVFDFPKRDLDKLIDRDRNRLELSLRQGRQMVFEGEYKPADGSRELRAQFTYNKTFSHRDNLETQGSWTVDMRPDYTLSIWPHTIERIVDAEKIDAVVHIHFDAKYKIEKFIELFGTTGQRTGEPSFNSDDSEGKDELAKLKDQEDKGVYKRGDLLKMHAYNDAIRRTYGSYILYPGDKDDPKRRYREIIPGIGAFVLRPGKQEMAGASKIEKFIRKVIVSLQNRLSQRERTAMYDWNVHRFNPVDLPLAARNVSLPDRNSSGEPFIPAEEYILMCYYHSSSWEWIKKNGYNFRVGLSRGSLGITSVQLKADYILLHSETAITDKLFKIEKEHGPRLVSKQDMIKLGYPNPPSSDAYLLFKLIPIRKDEPLYGITCDISKLPQYSGARTATHPITITFQDILLHAVI